MTKTYPQYSFTPPPGSTEITLVRHGQSQAAKPDELFELVGGHGDPPLTELGHRQAEAVGEALASETFDALYVSTLTRTHQTAEPLRQRLGMETIVEPDLREVFLGEWEGGIFRRKAEEGDPAVLRMRETGDWGEIPGAEDNETFTARCVGAIERIMVKHPDQKVAAFVHGGVIGAVLSHATRGHLFGTGGADNGSIHRLVVHPERWFLRGFNDINHLGEVGTPRA